jgi:hypothetical protein
VDKKSYSLLNLPKAFGWAEGMFRMAPGLIRSVLEYKVTEGYLFVGVS